MGIIFSLNELLAKDSPLGQAVAVAKQGAEAFLVEREGSEIEKAKALLAQQEGTKVFYDYNEWSREAILQEILRSHAPLTRAKKERVCEQLQQAKSDEEMEEGMPEWKRRTLNFVFTALQLNCNALSFYKTLELRPRVSDVAGQPKKEGFALVDPNWEREGAFVAKPSPLQQVVTGGATELSSNQVVAISGGVPEVVTSAAAKSDRTFWSRWTQGLGRWFSSWFSRSEQPTFDQIERIGRIDTRTSRTLSYKVRFRDYSGSFQLIGYKNSHGGFRPGYLFKAPFEARERGREIQSMIEILGASSIIPLHEAPRLNGDVLEWTWRVADKKAFHQVWEEYFSIGESTQLLTMNVPQYFFDRSMDLGRIDRIREYLSQSLSSPTEGVSYATKPLITHFVHQELIRLAREGKVKQLLAFTLETVDAVHTSEFPAANFIAPAFEKLSQDGPVIAIGALNIVRPMIASSKFTTSGSRKRMALVNGMRILVNHGHVFYEAPDLAKLGMRDPDEEVRKEAGKLLLDYHFRTTDHNNRTFFDDFKEAFSFLSKNDPGGVLEMIKPKIEKKAFNDLSYDKKKGLIVGMITLVKHWHHDEFALNMVDLGWQVVHLGSQDSDNEIRRLSIELDEELCDEFDWLWD